MRRVVLIPAVGVLLLALTALAFIALDPSRWSALGERLSGSIDAPQFASKLVLETVTVEGRVRTDPDLLLAALNVDYGSEMASIDVTGARKRIEALPWVKHAVVERRLPNKVHISLVEQEPFAIWQQGASFALIDAAGVPIITVESLESDLPLLVGQDAASQGKAFLESLAEEDTLSSRVRAAAFISKRRWDVHLDTPEDGVQIKLPAEQYLDAWHKLAVLDRRYGITKRGVASIDLRIPGQLIVTMKDGRRIRDLNDLQSVQFTPVRGVPG